MATSRKRLGRGLDSLLSTDTRREDDPEPAPRPESPREILVAEIEPNPHQPRREFGLEGLADLRRSIEEKGVLQPVIVRPVPAGFQLVVGERRLRACAELGLATIPAIVRDIRDEEMLEIALIENIQRENLNPIEKALAYRQLIQTLSLTHEQAAARVGKNRSSITNYLRLLELPRAIHDLIADHRLSMGHARALLALPESEEQERAAQEIVTEGLSVRETERRFSQPRVGKPTPEPTRHDSEDAEPPDHQIRAFEREFEEALATKVRIVRRGDGGQIILDFYTDAEFSRLRDLLLGQ